MSGDRMVIRGQTYDGWMAEIADLRAENERLREALKSIQYLLENYPGWSRDIDEAMNIVVRSI